MKWKCKIDDRYVVIALDDGRISGMRERGEAFGPRYSVLAELYHRKAPLAVVKRDGFGTLVEAATGRVVAQDRPGKWAELLPHVGHKLYVGDHCCEELIYVECVECGEYIYDCVYYE